MPRPLAVLAAVRNAVLHAVAMLAVPALLVPSVLLAAEPAATAGRVDPLDWPTWRGPEMSGVSREKGLINSWSPEGENLLWRKKEYGTRCTPVTLNGKLYFISRHLPESTQEQEKVVALDAATGETVWEYKYNLYLTDAPAERVGWSSVVADPETGNVYAQGLGATFHALDGATGKLLWSRSMSEEFGLLSTYGGRTNFPVVFEDLVIVSGVMTGWGDYAVPAHRFIAFDKRNGTAVWFFSTRLRPEDTTYSTPVFTVQNGQALMVVGAGDGSIYAVQPRTGKMVWQFDASTRGLNVAPLVVGDKVYFGHGEQGFKDQTVLGAVFAFDATGTGNITETKQLWSIPKKTVSRASPVLFDNKVVYIEDGASMFAVDPEKGKEVGKLKLGRIMFGSPVVADGKMYVGEATGMFYILEPGPKGPKVLHKVRLEGEEGPEEILGSPIVSHGKIYLPTLEAMYCLGEKDKAPSADPIPTAAPEAKLSDKTPAHIQLVPVEMLLKPGSKQAVQVRVFNQRGQFIGYEKAEVTVKGPGQVDATGAYVVPAETGHAVAILTAKLGELTSVARARIVPPLPWSFTFDDKQVPPTWIGAAYRHKPFDLDGQAVLQKVTTIPKGTRSQSWMGQPTFKNYTVQADLRGAKKNGKMPDMGLINSRYTLDVMGSQQQLQLRSWTPRLELRFAKTIPFSWNPDTWYTVKFRSEVIEANGVATKIVVKGKVWPKGEQEPKDWLIEGEDLTPNTSGSPGLFGNASDADVFIDNVTVTPNE
jgi:outer membrane protein assembly factor BamB